MSCKSVADWLHREVESLDEAQRLVLDDHLATCASCRGDRARMQLVRAFGQSLPIPPPGAREYNRAIASALLEGKRVEQRERPRRLKWIVPIIAFASVATAATVAGVVATKNESTAPAPAPPETPARVEARIPEPEPEPEPEPAPAQPVAPPTTDAEAPTPAPAPAPAPAHAHDRVGSPTPTPTLTPTAAELLELARTQFAAKHLDDAERTAQSALSARPTRALRAEIQILLADVAQASGNPDLAVERYTAVSTTFAGTDAAESALYAAARVELKRRDLSAARTLLGRYLDRYPTGRFADDARRELAALR